MAIIKIDKNIKLEDVESCYNELHGYIDKQLSIDLSLPKILEHNYFGLIPSLYQFAVTWVRYSNSWKLLLDIDNINETDLDKLATHVFVEKKDFPQANASPNFKLERRFY